MSFNESPPIHLFPGAITWRGINIENSIIRGSTLRGQKPPFWISVNLQVPDEAGQASFCVTISKREKVGAQPFISCISWLMWVSVKILITFFLVYAKFKCQTLFRGISDATNMVIYSGDNKDWNGAGYSILGS